MSFCINPNCPKPEKPANAHSFICRHCGSQLLLQHRYRVMRVLGESGFGKTYEVDDGGTPKVLKVLLVNAPKAVTLFQQEALVLSKLNHPGVPKVEADGYFTFFPKDCQEPLYCLVMEKIDGLTLEEWLRQTPEQFCSQEQALIWLRQLAEILLQVHERLYFHQDIKPSNIMLRPNGQLALIDFGSAREVTLTYLTRVSEKNDVTGIVSPGYTPIEQANGKAVPQSDFFALGRTFVFLLTGKSPNDFPEDPRSGSLLWHHRASHIAKPITDLIDYLMASSPSNRPHNAQMILHSLDAIALALHLPQLCSQTQSVNDREISPQLARGQNRSSQARIKKIKTKIAKSKKEILASCGILVLGIAGIQIYNDLGPTPSQSSAEPLSDREILLPSPILVEDQPTQMVSLPLQKSNSEPKKQPVHVPTGNLHGINSIAISPDGNTLVSGNRDGLVQLWQMGIGKVKSTLKGHLKGVNSVAISPSGQIASGGEDNTIKLWDMKMGEAQLPHTLKGHSAWVSSVGFSPDGKTLVSGSYDNTIKLWDLRTDKTPVPRTLKGHSGWVLATAVSPRSPILASGGYDNTIKLWDLKFGKLLRTLKISGERVFALAISPDGKTLASGSGDGKINLWDVETGELKTTFQGHTDWVLCVAFSPDGKTLASGSGDRDGTIKLWNLDNGELLRTLSGHSDRVRSVAFSPDGKTLASASYDNTIKIWQLR